MRCRRTFTLGSKTRGIAPKRRFVTTRMSSGSNLFYSHRPTNNLLEQPQLGFIVGFRSAKSRTGAQLQNTETMHSTACHPEPRQAGPANSYSAAFSHDPRLRLEALTESRDTSRYNRTFIAYANQPKLAPHIINVNIPSPAHSPLFLPPSLLPVTHHFPVSPTPDAVSPFQESAAAPARQMTPSPQAGTAPYSPRHHTASSARAFPLALRLDTACGPAAAAPFPQQECSYDSAESGDEIGPPLPRASNSFLRERNFPSEEEGGEGERPRRPSEHGLRRGLIPGEPSAKPDTSLSEPSEGVVRSVPTANC
ncbi:hypothetical protein HC256_000050 [Beauveria bassiana]|nr:hypothetical protein HC256_000050 [Beauveria bassiana]